jgi:recombination protein RecT
LLEKYKGQIAVALPRHLTPERMIRIALTAVSQTPKLQECNPYTICGAIVQASILGLEPNSTLGEAFLVPYWNKKANNGKGGYDCQLQIGYKGHVKLARNSGEIAMVDAQPVYDGDDFEFEKGDAPYLKHKWGKKGARGNVIGYWAGFKTKDGTFNFEYWSLEEITSHRDKYTKSRDREGRIYGPWIDNPDWMCRKTVLIQSLKLAPKSVQLATALAVDEHPGAAFSIDVPLELQPAQEDEPLALQEPKRKASDGKPPAKLYDYADWERAQESADFGKEWIKVAGVVYRSVDGNYQEFQQ